jgi:hypothetical protein
MTPEQDNGDGTDQFSPDDAAFIIKARRAYAKDRARQAADAEKRQLEVDAEPARAWKRKQKRAATAGGIVLLGAEEILTLLNGIADLIVKLASAFG